MRFRRGYAWQQRSRTRPVLITTLIAIPLAVGLIVGVVVNSHSAKSGVALSANGFGIGHHHRHRGPFDPGSGAAAA